MAIHTDCTYPPFQKHRTWLEKKRLTLQVLLCVKRILKCGFHGLIKVKAPVARLMNKLVKA